MGIIGSKNEEELLKMIEQHYEVQEKKYLTDKQSKRMYTLHRITSRSSSQASTVIQNIHTYEGSHCNSISKLKEHYHINNTGYCSDQEKFYLIFQGNDKFSIHDQALRRKTEGLKFAPHEITNILSAILCGSRQYVKTFGRTELRISLQAVGINQNSHLFLKDPWLSETSTEPIPFLNTYPSPEKLNAGNNFSTFDQFKSYLFSIGVLGLQLIFVHKDDIYQSKRQINKQLLYEQLNSIGDGRLRKGLQILLHDNPNERQNIYAFWNIKCDNVYCLAQKQQPSLKQNTVATSSNDRFPFVQEKIKVSDPVEINKTNSASNLRFYPPQNNHPIPPPQLKVQQYKHEYEQKKTIPIQGRSQSVYFTNTVSNERVQPISTYKTPNFDYRSPAFHYESEKQKLIRNNMTYHQSPIHSFSVSNSINSVNSGKVGQTSYDVNRSFGTVIASQPNSMNFSKVNVKEAKVLHSQPQQPKTMNTIPSETINSLSPEKKEKGGLQKAEQLIRSLEKIQKQPLPEGAQMVIPYPKIERSPISENNNVSPPQIEITPQPIRNPNKHNSTIVQVNEETPNQSENEEDDPNEQMEFVVEEYETGSRYEGYKKNNIRNGKGKFYYQDGGYYDGQWRDNQMHGWGKLFYEGGKLAYEGNWANDEFHGFGKVFNDNPLPIPNTAGFDYTNFDLLDDYWQHYEGMLMKDTKEGRGRILLTNGETFEGDFHNDRIQGFGKFTKLDGSIIEGIWRDSRLIKVLSTIG